MENRENFQAQDELEIVHAPTPENGTKEGKKKPIHHKPSSDINLLKEGLFF